MADCIDHGWECTGLGHEKEINLADIFGRNEGEVMVIPFNPTCELFEENLSDQGVDNRLSLLDIRLGLEQLLDDQDFRAELTNRWAQPDPAAIELGPDTAFDLFLAVSQRHQELTVSQVKEATAAIIDTPEFITEAQARWVRYDADPWPLVEQDLAGFDDAA